jgi:hypothetical protein
MENSALSHCAKLIRSKGEEISLEGFGLPKLRGGD